MAEHVVVKLLDGLEKKLITVNMDNFYTSIVLAETLLRKDIYMTETFVRIASIFRQINSNSSNEANSTPFSAKTSARSSGKINVTSIF